jgi:diketogulonate reductase-like aldo/keto reductase
MGVCAGSGSTIWTSTCCIGHSRRSSTRPWRQVELHPYFTQRDVRDADADRGVVTQSWSPIGGAILRHAEDPSTAENVLTDPTIVELAAKHHKTPAQIVLRWHIDHGLSAIPKSVCPQRIAENIDIFDFALNADEIAAIDALNSGVRAGPDPDQFDASKASITVED